MTRDTKRIPGISAVVKPDLRLRLQAIGCVIPNKALLADYIALAALLHRPDLAARHVNRLHPADFAKPLHQHTAQMALTQVQGLGRADLRQIYRLFIDGDFSRLSLDIELSTIRCVADLLDHDIVDWAAHALIADRPRWRGRGAA